MKKQQANPVSKSEPLEPGEVEKHLKTWFPDFAVERVEKLTQFYVELAKFNKTVNLVSPNTIRNADAVHIADCLLASGIIAPVIIADQPVYDFGSGNGCPGIIYGLLNPTHKVILIDRDQRKIEFCKHVASLLKLQNVMPIAKGIEDLPMGEIRNVVARGFAPFARALLISRKVFADGGRFFHLKADGWANELAAMPSQVFTHWSPSLLGRYRLPESTTEMFVVLTEKISAS